MISSIEITNWKTHKSTKLNFQKGVNVLIGIMGAGKSSVMDAISFGLFGTFPALLQRRVTLEDLISNLAESKEAEVRLNFTANDDSYSVIRKISPNGNSAKLEKNGQYLQTQAARVNEEVENLLKIDYDTFSRAIYAEQNQLDYFLELTKGDRKKQIDRMLGLDNFAIAEENATTLINTIKSTIKAEEEILARIDVKELKEQMKRTEDEMAAHQKETEELEKMVKEQRQSLDLTKKKLDEQKALFQKKKSINDETLRINSRINTLDEEIEKIKALNINEERLKKDTEEKTARGALLSGELSELKKSERETVRKLSEAESEAKNAEKKIAERDRIREQNKGKTEEALSNNLDEAEKGIAKMLEDISSFKSRKSETEEWMKELSKHLSVCPVCERELGEELRQKLVSKKKSTLSDLDSQIKDISAKIEEKKKVHKELSEELNSFKMAKQKLAEYSDIEMDLDSSRKERERRKKELEDIAAKLDRTTKEHESISKELQKLNADSETIKRKNAYAGEISKSMAILKAKKEEASSIFVDEKEIDVLQDSLTKQSARLSDMESKIEGNRKYIKNLQDQIEEKGKQVRNFSDMEKKIEKRRSQLSNLNKFKAALIDTEALLRNQLVSSINSLMQALWRELYPYGDYMGIRLNAKKDDYSLEVNTSIGGESEWLEVDGIASGGERSISCLTMRIALAMVIVPNLKWLILDEPTHNIDSNGIAKLIEVLTGTLPKVVEQIFIITHDEELKQVGSAKIYQLERDKAANGHTTIAET